MAASVWSGYLTFGLISMPVRLFSGARGERVSFHMLHRDDLTRIKQQLYCPNDNRVVERSEIVKGYEFRKGEYVVVEPEEIKKIEPRTAKAMEILEFLGIAALRDEKPESLPHGHQKALGVAIALASEPKLLLLDEPATGMNPSESDMMISHIHQVRKRGVTVIVVEHDMRVVRSVCDRLVSMNFGQKLCEGDPDYVTSHPEVCEAYLGKGAVSVA
jgi:ABC-type branched-subunit amino acid transport system ATPase component